MPEEVITPPQEAPPKPSGRFTNKTPLLVLFLLLITGILVYIALAPQRDSQSPSNIGVEDEKAQTRLFFADAPALSNAVSSASALYVLDVNITTGANKASGVQLEIDYSPKEITILDIEAGEFIVDPVEIRDKIDAENGRISYAITTPLGSDQISGEGVVARIKFTVPPSAASGEIGFSFADQTTVVSESTSLNILQESVDALFTPGDLPIITQ